MKEKAITKTKGTPKIKYVKAARQYCVTFFDDQGQKQAWFSDETEARQFWQERLAEEAGEGEEVKNGKED